VDFSLITLAGTQYHDNVSEVLLRTSEGDAVIMPHHEPLTAVVLGGPLTIRSKSKKEDIFAIYGGILEIEDNRVTLLADEADHIDSLIESNIAEALKLAENLKNNAQSKSELQRAKQIVDRHAIRLDVSRIRRRKHR
jgi:F-type H+-transporting ATPase subunit epsilon